MELVGEKDTQGRYVCPNHCETGGYEDCCPCGPNGEICDEAKK